MLVLAACSDGVPPAVARVGVQQQNSTDIATARAGDTVWSVAARYNLPARDIIALNNLAPPYALGRGARLRLPPPATYKVRHDDTLYSVSRMFNMTPTQMAEANGLHSPYILHVGQVLHIVQGVAAPTPPISNIALNPTVSAPVPVRLASAAPSAEFLRVLNQHRAQDPPQQAQGMDVSSSGFLWPVRGRVISGYGPKDGGLYNDGINIAAPRGTPVHAAAAGTVAYVGHALESYGNLVLVRHAGGMITAYAHLGIVTVKQGATVKKGQMIGGVGSTGAVSTAQLHFEIRKGAETLDPARYL